MEKKDSCIIYIHGLHGHANEASFYSSIYKNRFDVIGLDYEDGIPWQVKDTIIKEFVKLTKPYKNIYVIANSVGAFYTFMYLSNLNIKEAFFISPLVNMDKFIENLMVQNDISLERLKKEKYIKIGDNDMLSYDFNLEVQKGDNWKVKTNILYGENDSMVDKESLMKFVNSHDATLTIMSGGEHYFHTFGQLKFLKNWLKELL